MDIIVTTPKSQMRAAAREAANCIAAGGGEYFRRFHLNSAPTVKKGDRVYYVEDGYVRGFAVVSRDEWRGQPQQCHTTGHVWLPGIYVFMDATTWKWIEPVPMQGFQGVRYAHNYFRREDVSIVGGWRDPR